MPSDFEDMPEKRKNHHHQKDKKVQLTFHVVKKEKKPSKNLHVPQGIHIGAPSQFHKVKVKRCTRQNKTQQTLMQDLSTPGGSR